MDGLIAIAGVAMQVLARRMPVQAERIAAHPALLGINCLLLAAVWLSVVDAGSFGEVLARAAGIAAGYVLAALVLARLQTRLATAPVPDVLRGPAIALITAGIASLALLGLAGQVSSP
jgi:electron transport complex protein RnfA